MSDERLKPCPFCGGEATFIGNTRTIKCKCCGGAFVCTNPIITALEVAAAWNTRKPMERIVEMMEELLKDVDGDTNSGFVEMCIDIVKGGGVDE